MKNIFISVVCLLMLLFFNYNTLAQCDSIGINPTAPNSGSGMGITNITFADINHTTPIEEGYTNELDSSATAQTNVYRGEEYVLTIDYSSSCGLQGYNIGVWIDWNGDGQFNSLPYFPPFIYGEQITITQFFTSGTDHQINIKIPNEAKLANVKMRIMLDASCMPGFGQHITSPCDSITGDVEDYLITVFPNHKVEQVNTSCQTPCSQNNPVLRIQIDPETLPSVAKSFSFTTNGTTNPADITNADLYYTGTSPQLDTTTLFGSSVNPNGSFVISGTQSIPVVDSYFYYFWLVYDISCGAIDGNLLDATCTQINVDTAGVGQSINPRNPDPNGNNVICSIIPEICNNGIDDDKDGLVDCYDGDCAGIAGCISDGITSFYGLPQISCNKPKLPEPFAVDTLWLKSIPSLMQAITPVVGDIDNDGMPEIVAPNNSDSIYILDGQTGAIEVRFPLSSSVAIFASISIADIDGDGLGEIFIPYQNNTTACYENDGTLKWLNTTSSVGGINGLADFDGDGKAEIYFKNGSAILNAQTGVEILSFGEGISEVADILPDGYCPDCDGLEVITSSNKIYGINISNGRATVATSFGALGSSSNKGLADFDGDGLLDLVICNTGDIQVINPRTNSIILGPTAMASAGRYPSIADVDGDGKLEIAVVTNTELILFDDNLIQSWAFSFIVDLGQPGTAMMIFDFEGDDNMEIAYSGSAEFFVFDAVTGGVLYRDGCGTSTAVEHPAVVDVNADGEANIVSFCSAGTVNVYKSGTCAPWVAARRVMNQQDYIITNINDDLTVPAFRQSNAQTKYFNSYSQQIPLIDTSGTPVSTLQSDILSVIQIGNIQFNACYNSDTVSIPVQFCNEGCAIASPNMTVSFYDKNPLTGGTLIKTETININLPMDSCMVSIFDIFFTDSVNLYIVANDSGIAPLSSPVIGFDECWLDNNTDSINIKIDFDTVTITASTSQDTICIGSSSTILISGGNSSTEYTWNPNINLVQLDSTGLVSPTLSTIYVITVMDTLTACSSIDSILITVDTFSIVNLGNDTTICPGDTLILNAGTGGMSYLWSTGDTLNTIQINTSGLYSVSVNGILCISQDSIDVSNTPFPTAGISPDTLICAGSFVQLQATGGTNYLWLPDSGLSQNTISDPTATRDESITYTVYVSNVCNDIDSANIIITVDPCSYYIPNAFSPNGDGINDNFYVQGSGFKTYLLKIYDRWGNKVFESYNTNIGWNGEHNNKMVSQGVYVYTFTATFENGNEVNEKGNVTLLK